MAIVARNDRSTKGRDFLDPQNIGEVAFAHVCLAVISGAVFAIAAICVWFFSEGFNASVIAVTGWLITQYWIYLHLKKRVDSWGEERPGCRQVIYFELCSLVVVLALTILAWHDPYGMDFVHQLKVIFTLIVLVLLVAQVLTHLAYRYPFRRKDVLRWLVITLTAGLNILLVGMA
ncbi:hypothetical protein [Cerasicoccus maritimus]|uniref:hypothetical protein n=1 Tax=Cerasicoccus maritimus TaxID=490089 RepID=UPI002852A459|nr:hypothetical protein [Cerasicoccus maritimus]